MNQLNQALAMHRITVSDTFSSEILFCSTHNAAVSM